MRLISLVLLSFIATNTVAIYIPKVYPVHVRGFLFPAEDNSNKPSLPTEDNSNEPSSCQPNPTDANEQRELTQSASFTSRMSSYVIGLLTNIRGLCGRRREHNDAVSVENDQVEFSASKEAVESPTPNSPKEEIESSTPDPPEKAVESLTPDSSEEAVESPIPIPPKEGDIIGHIKFLKKTIEEAMVMEQKAKDQAKKSHTTSDKATTDSSSNSGSDESENDPELLIEIAQEASPSPLMAKIYATQIRNVAGIKSLVDEVVKSVTGIEKADYTLEHKVIQKAAIQRSRGYLQELTDISEGTAKTLGIIPKKSTFKDRSRLLKLVSKTYRFNAITDDALLRSRQKHITSGKGRKSRKGRKGRKGREDLVTSKEILDDQKKKLHRTTILEENEDEEEEQDAKD
ncbi:hypothetical protein BASA50_001404 [Batrachochytrium salamandrivorans]|uniref:Uncharacterized protein n=1 Tax=Batrachochytrium salamandrivorans TaxID=1357716 RepID=A0ABQ8EV82_9FUNG|nr:hypothetical protein BASA50_001404 [Batrachochytrium salamandrivorans]